MSPHGTPTSGREGMKNRMKNRLKRGVWLVMAALFALALLACDKEPPERELVVGPWKETLASYHTIISFRANGSFGIIRLVEGQHSKIDETADKTKVDGKWKLLPPEMEGDPLLLIMTPEMVQGEVPWEVDTPVTYLVERVTRNRMMLRGAGGEHVAWDRLRSTKAPEEEGGIPLARVACGPLVVGLTKARPNEESRYLCVQLDLGVDDMEGAACVEEARLPSGEPSGSYRLHPSLREALVLHLSRLTYRDVRSLKRFQNVAGDLERILTPYFGTRLRDVKVVRVVVTTKQEGVDAFLTEFAPKNAAPPEAAGS